ncbi:MAG: hypothetical protein MJ048_01265 [Acidaminococcaceae bacterium]|nr:hypothetical protein [Acidaminococcaceae bacterium]
MFFSKKKATNKKSAVETKKVTASKEVASSKKETGKVKEPAKAKETTKKVEPTKAAETSKVVTTAKTTDAIKTTDKNDNLTKTEKLRKYFQKNKMEMFTVEEVKDANETAVFRARMEIGNTLLPMAILLDSSAYVLIQVELMPTFIKNDEQFELFAKPLNALNNAVRPFKFAISGKGDFMLNMILTFPNAQFEPALCHAFVVEIMKYLDKDYKNLVNACLKIMGK